MWHMVEDLIVLQAELGEASGATSPELVEETPAWAD